MSYTERMKIFLAGIMQGSLPDAEMHGQDYRSILRRSLQGCFPEADIYDPLEGHQESLEYDERRGRKVFVQHNELCREVDLVVAYLPQASMGTAIEMWEAHRAGRLVFAITPLAHNWAIRFTSDRIWASLAEFLEDAQSGKLRDCLQKAAP